ncbi:CmcI family methyltransferase [Mesorhizobium sp.]|uniref:class I SAM-dependent methyltransferase n=1 Tax=Mesorhizobium sp. TaxID=1871066 RepID=UPI0025D65A87|nr:CmcI family methyltransferase [Mesorhizobium sp.]
MDYIEALSVIHGILRPRSYLEIGCRFGHSLALSAAPSIGVDPDYEIRVPLKAPTRLFAETSDEFFRRDVVSLMGGPVDLAFIDGMHSAEFALRDFINCERTSHAQGVIVIDDVLPRDIAHAKRERDTQIWTGDIYKLVMILRKFRPDLVVETYDIEMKGLCIVSGLRPSDTTLAEAYGDIEAAILAGDYQLETAEEIARSVAPRSTAFLETDLERLSERRRSKRGYETGLTRADLFSYQAGTMNYRYRNIPCLKSPIDIAIYLRLLGEQQPASIFELGSKHGGSALLFRDMCRAMDIPAQIVSVDLDPPGLSALEGVRFLKGDAADLEPLFREHRLFDLPRPWLVVEDSAHSFAVCTSVLDFFEEHLRTGEYLVMEDGVLDELGLSARYQGGPNRAIAEFLARRPGSFEIDAAYCDMFGRNMTYNPNGYLRRV